MIKINKLFILYTILLFLIGFQGDFIIAFFMVLLHEIVHYLTAKYFGITGFDIEILPFGANIYLKEMDEASPKEDFIISLSGPLFNFLLAVLFYALNVQFNNKLLFLLYSTNAALFTFNLLPALPLDGGRILRDLISTKTQYKKANFITSLVSISFGFILMFFYFITFFKHQGNLSLGLVAIYIIICSYKEKERFAYIIMSDIIKKKYKLLKRGYMENKTFSIFYKKDLLSILSICEKNKYNAFTVLDEELNIMDIIYEGEVLEALKRYGNITIEQFIKARREEE